MHIPNGFLDPKVSAGTAFAAATVLGYCVAKVRQALASLVPESVLAGAGNIAANITDGSKKMISSLAENHIMKMGAVASLIFAAQMFNFPIADGTSGHLLGGIIAAIALGPFSGAIAISIVIAVQSIFFGDGGLTALGANILNMSVIGTLSCYYIYYIIHRLIRNKYGYYSGIAFASFFSVVLASLFCSFEIGFSRTIGLWKVLSAMIPIHARIGIAEALLTIAALELLVLLKFGLDGIADKSNTP